MIAKRSLAYLFTNITRTTASKSTNVFGSASLELLHYNRRFKPSSIHKSSILMSYTRNYGTNPSQRAQAATAGRELGKLRSKQIQRLRGAMKLSDGSLELDVKKNKVLEKMVATLTKEGLPKETIARHLDPKRKLIELKVMADGPEGMMLLIECESKHFQLAKGVIANQSKKANMKLQVTEAHDWQHYFESKGFITIPNKIDGKTHDEEMATDLAIEVGAEEVALNGDTLELVCSPSDYKDCLETIEERKIKIIDAKLDYRPLDKIELDDNYAVFFEAFSQKIMSNIDVNFNFIKMTTNFDS